ncbi:S-layer homology domain-containing protein [Paenibacillus sp. HN-1]|uniref:S-layer homology domain-containing protein n=1 Tax=Paenibacillus TaxID=44249 RepID=UPI001CA9A201|nr:MULTISPECIES: S-layer homology domain-containing protein [Paenibacillus]MBY9081407.1 S-layer homology domain-containing protein [Paenibacillus sp. CGMCC 1.18879]MBY9084927.1 S-layer homology domain-containing protein [Paenibacillus sinensis]
MRNNRLLRFMSILLAAVLLLIPVTEAASAAPVPAPALSLEAPDTAQAGGQVSVTVKGDNLADLYAYELTLAYDPQKLTYKSVAYDLESAGYGLPVSVSDGKLTYAFTKVGDQTSGTDGSHGLLTVTFQAAGSGAALVRLSGITLIDSKLKSVKLEQTVDASILISQSQDAGSGTGGSGTGTDNGPGTGTGSGTDTGTGSGTDTSSGTGSSQGATSGSSSSAQTGAGSPAAGGTPVVITPEMVKGGAGSSQATLPFPADALEIRIPADVMSLLSGRVVAISGQSFSLDIPSAVSAALAGRLSASGSFLSLKMKPYSPAEASALLSSGSTFGTASSSVEVAGQTFGFTLSVNDGQGTAIPVKSFDSPLTLRLRGDSSRDRSLTGIYYIDDNGKTEFQGAKWEGDLVSASIRHFSVYSVLKVSHEFKDVPAAHWANEAIRTLAARGIADGSGAGQFEPGRKVTRAEFSAMLVRMLRLPEDTGVTAFKDVPSGSWYAGAVGAAHEAGLVNGRSGGVFDPGGTLTRQEMAVMLTKAASLLSGTAPSPVASGAAVVPFKDTNRIAAWADAAVRSAYAQGLIKGRTDTEFAPEAAVTRAEAAQALFNMAEHSS